MSLETLGAWLVASSWIFLVAGYSIYRKIRYGKVLGSNK